MVEKVNTLLELLVDSLDIPKSYYLKTVDRHKSFSEWLCRPESRLAKFNPTVHPQGSFRYGTVIRPLDANAEYDLDNVTTLEIAKTAFSQKQIKEMFGTEIRAYAEAHNMIAPIEEKNRCWRLRYSDEAAFHLDALPCVPEEPAILAAIGARGVPKEWADLAVAITDKRHPEYNWATRRLFSSNPRGFARWFEQCVRPSALDRIQLLVHQRIYANVEDVPPYEWKTALQRAIQLFKRHRDVMFRNNPEVAPISMIITNLAAHAYGGETDLWTAVSNTVNKMSEYVNESRPRVPNPADPAEDYADHWIKDRLLEENFWSWHAQLRADLQTLASVQSGDGVANAVRRMFSVELTRDHLKHFDQPVPTPAVVRSTAAVSIPSAPKPWGK